MDSGWEEADGYENEIEGKLFFNSSAHLHVKNRDFSMQITGITSQRIIQKVTSDTVWVKLCISLRSN